MFGLQFYGECWSAPNGLNTYDKHNTADDEKCVMEIDWNAGAWVHCDIASDEACVGKDNTNYIYILEEGVCLNMCGIIRRISMENLTIFALVML